MRIKGNTFFKIKDQNRVPKEWNELDIKTKQDFIKKLLTGEKANIPGFGKIFWKSDVGISFEEFKDTASKDISTAMEIIGDIYNLRMMQKYAENDPIEKAFSAADASASKELEDYMASQAEQSPLGLGYDKLPDLGPPTSLQATADRAIQDRINNTLAKTLTRFSIGNNGIPATPEQVIDIVDIIKRNYATHLEGATLVPDQGTGKVQVMWKAKSGNEFKSPKISVAKPTDFRESKEKSPNQLILENHRKNRKPLFFFTYY